MNIKDEFKGWLSILIPVVFAMSGVVEVAEYDFVRHSNWTNLIHGGLALLSMFVFLPAILIQLLPESKIRNFLGILTDIIIATAVYQTYMYHSLYLEHHFDWWYWTRIALAAVMIVYINAYSSLFETSVQMRNEVL